MPFEDVLLHEGKPIRTSTGGTWIEGEFVPADPEEGVAFDCVLFLPAPGSEDTTTVIIGRRIVEPTLLYAVEDHVGAVVGLDAEDQVLVNAPELNEARGLPVDFWERYSVVGEPQPFGKPGDAVIGFQATLRRAEE